MPRERLGLKNLLNPSPSNYIPISLPAMQVGESPESETVERLFRQASPQNVSVDACLRDVGVDALA